MKLTKFDRIIEIEGDDLVEVNKRLSNRWHIIAIRTERISGNVNEFKDHLTFVMGLSMDEVMRDYNEDEEPELDLPIGPTP